MVREDPERTLDRRHFISRRNLRHRRHGQRHPLRVSGVRHPSRGVMNKIAIHGLGYVGLTAAVHWARAGWTVLAYDRDTKVIDALRSGTPRAGEFLSYLDADVGRL